jgi:hypothetical protein
MSVRRHVKAEPTQELHVLAVYNGRICMGHIRERGRACIALTWPGEIDLGAYATRRDAADAISAAYKNGRRA